MKTNSHRHLLRVLSRCVAIAAACAFLSPVSATPMTVGDFVTRNGPAIGTWTAGAKPVTGSSANVTGAFGLIHAGSFNSNDTPTNDEDILPKAGSPTTYPAAGGTATYATRQTKRSGLKFEAQSKVSVTAKTNAAGTQVDWTATPATYGIKVLAPSGAPGERTDAFWFVRDPMDFSGLANIDIIDLLYEPGDEWDFTIAPLAGNVVGSYEHFGAARSSLPGLENLLSWNIFAHSGSLGSVVVDFLSHPVLGLDDAAIIASILSRFSYDAGTGAYDFDSSGFSIAASFDVPDGVSALSLETEVGSRMSAVHVGEPAALALCALGLLGAASVRRRRPVSGTRPAV